MQKWFVFSLRWVPPIGLTTLLAGICLVPAFRRFFLLRGGVSSLVILLVWVVTAWVVSITAHEQLVRNLRKLTPRRALIAGTIVGLLLVFRHSISRGLIPLSLLLMHLSAAAENPRRSLTGGVFTAMLTLILVEAFLALPLSSPSLWKVPGFDLLALRRYWSEIDLIQWNPECSQWDPKLSYTLRPGTCTFSNPGYKTQYRINRLGVRDDEKSLIQPEIVVLGDSHTMGMGVEQEETYASQLEKMIGVKTLNTGISSYGTARELGMLQRVDRSRTRYLLIQYCSNDFEENREFIERGDGLPGRSPEWYESQVEASRSGRRYYLGRFTDSVLWFIWEGLQRRLPRDSGVGPGHAGRSKESLEYLLKVVERHPVELSGTEIVIFQMDFPSDYREGNAPYLERLLADSRGSGRLNNVQVVDVMKGLGPEHFLPLDGHMNAVGHRKVAERLASVIR